MDPDALNQVEQFDPRQRLYRADATLWVWILYGLVQATITMLMAFDVITTLTATQVITSVALVMYVAVNELIVRPRWRRKSPLANGTPEASDPNVGPTA